MSLWDLQCSDFLRCQESGVVGQFPSSPGHDTELLSGHHCPKYSACLDCSRILTEERNSRGKHAGIRGQAAIKSFQNFLCLLLLICFTPRKREYSPQALYTLQCETTMDSFRGLCFNIICAGKCLPGPLLLSPTTFSGSTCWACNRHSPPWGHIPMPMAAGG